MSFFVMLRQPNPLPSVPSSIIIEEESNGVVHVVLISCTSLLVYIHVPEIKTQVMIQVLFDADEKPVLIHGVVNDVLSEIQQNFIRNNKRRQFRLLEDAKIGAKQVAHTVDEPGFSGSLVVVDLLYPSLLVPESLGQLGFAVAGTEYELLIYPVLVHPSIPVRSGRREPGMSIPNCCRHFFLDPEIGS
jgi:hypothetical protein